VAAAGIRLDGAARAARHIQALPAQTRSRGVPRPSTVLVR